MIYGIGVDIVSIKRFREMYEKHGRRLLNKIFSQAEIEYILSKNSPYPHMAARFAVKEAYSKALGTGIGEHANFNEISTENDENGKPHILLYGKTKREIERLISDRYEIHVSLSHEKEFAVAYVVISCL